MARSVCIAVISGHRCGSSLVAGILQELGVFMGAELLGTTRSNEIGHFEDLEFQRLHKVMIGDWRDPDPMLGKCRKPYRTLIRKREKLPLWGLKDPRLCFTFPYLVDALLKRTDLRAIYVRRDPNSAAASMIARAARDSAKHTKVTAGQAKELALHYEQQAENILIEWDGDILIVDYEELVQAPWYWVLQIACFVGVELTADAIAMVKPELKHL